MGIEWTSPKVWLLLGGLGAGCVVAVMAVVGILYAFKLIIPKSRLFDGRYIAVSMRRVRLLRRISFVALVIQMAIAALMLTLYVLEVIPFAFSGWMAAYLVVLLLVLPFGAEPFWRRGFWSRRFAFKSFWNAEDLQYALEQRRRLHKQPLE